MTIISKQIIKCAHIQAANVLANGSMAAIKDAMLQKHLSLITEAGKQGVQILCLQELFFGPYFCAEEDLKWRALAESIPGYTTELLREYAKKYQMVIIAPLYEKQEELYYNTAVIIDADGKCLGKMRKIHIPQMASGFFEKFYFSSGDLEFPVFATKYANIGVFICYDRHFPECARILALKGAEILFNPSAAADIKLRPLWQIEQTAQAVANGIFIGANNRVGYEEPWRIGEFYGSSFFVNPYGEILAQASTNQDEILIADLNLQQINAAREEWQFLQDRRPEMYKLIASRNQ